MCPNCGVWNSKVIDTRYDHQTKTVKRRRLCQHCRIRYTTREYVEDSPPRIREKLRTAKAILTETVVKINRLIGGWDAGPH